MIPTERPTPENTENYIELLEAGKASLRNSVNELHDTVLKRLRATHDHIVGGAHGDMTPHDLMQTQLGSLLEGISILHVLQPDTYAHLEQIIILMQALVMQTVPDSMRWEDFTRQMLTGLDKVRNDQLGHIEHPSMEAKIVARAIDLRSRKERSK